MNLTVSRREPARPLLTTPAGIDNVLSGEPDAALAAAAQRLGELSDEAYEALVARSFTAFAAGEAREDPIAAHPLHAGTRLQSSPE